MNAVRLPREEQGRLDRAAADARYAMERQRQVAALLLLATAVLVGTVLFVGVRNVFLPGWWRLW